MNQFHIGIAFFIMLTWIVFMRYTLDYLMKPPSDDSRMVRDTRGKAFGCAILYGTLIPGMLVMAYVSTSGVYRTPLDITLGGTVIVSFIANVIYLFMARFKPDKIGSKLQFLGTWGYILPITIFVLLLTYKIVAKIEM